MHPIPSGLTRWLLLGVLITAIGGLALARDVIVTTHDGRRFQGRLISEGEDQVVLDIAGIPTPIPRGQILRIDDQKSFEQIYRERRAKIPDTSLEDRYALAFYLYQNRAYDLALEELTDLHEQFPDSSLVASLLERVRQSRQFSQQAAREGAVPPAPGAATQPGAAAGPGSPDSPAPAAEGAPPAAHRLTEAQINAIRVWELPADPAAWPPVRVPRQVVDEFLQNYGGPGGIPLGGPEELAFRRASPRQQLQTIMRHRAREFYDRILVVADPPALAEFRSQLHYAYILGYCASVQCHGSPQAPANLYLLRTQPTSDQTFYTNFYILDRYLSPRGNMIDRSSPARSLLLQYGLPVQSAAVPHPEVPNWRPYFTSSEDDRFAAYVRVIGQLWSPDPDYGIDFLPPGATGPVTEPATAPSQAPDATIPPEGAPEMDVAPETEAAPETPSQAPAEVAPEAIPEAPQK